MEANVQEQRARVAELRLQLEALGSSEGPGAELQAAHAELQEASRTTSCCFSHPLSLDCLAAFPLVFFSSLQMSLYILRFMYTYTYVWLAVEAPQKP